MGPLLLLLAALLASSSGFSTVFETYQGGENSTFLGRFSGISDTDRTGKYYYLVQIISTSSGKTIGLGVAYNKKFVITVASVFGAVVTGPKTYTRAYTLKLTASEVIGTTAATTRESRRIYVNWNTATNKIVYPVAVVELCPTMPDPNFYVSAGSLSSGVLPTGPTINMVVQDSYLQCGVVAVGVRTMGEDCECDQEPVFLTANPPSSVFCIRASTIDWADKSESFLGAPLYNTETGAVVALNMGPGNAANNPEVGLKLFQTDIHAFIESIANPPPVGK